MCLDSSQSIQGNSGVVFIVTRIVASGWKCQTVWTHFIFSLDSPKHLVYKLTFSSSEMSVVLLMSGEKENIIRVSVFICVLGM